ncbi:unnamed protein product [Penicillium salamii]|nr:unnamed protein product [Penicillium salamii]CAG8304333.1 unnamed protein product [Penicillium salamii]
MRFSLCILPLWSLINHALGTGIELPVLPRFPSEDEFYKPPSGESWKKEPAGTILKSRNVTFATLQANVPSEAKAYQLLFVTQDVDEEPATTVTTIVVPQEANLNRLLSFQNAYDSADIDCSPSYGFQNQVTGPAYTWNQAQLSILGKFQLKGGPVISIPDYEGSNAAFTVGPQSAYQTLDSIRAALNSQDITGLNPEANTVLYGYSGGGLATEWATEFHASYAPTLKVIGAAMGGIPTYIANTYRHVNNGPFSELNVLATLGLANAFPIVNDYVKEHVLPEYAPAFFYPRVRCGPHHGIEKQPALSKVNITAIFDNGDDLLDDFSDLLEEVGIMGKRISEVNTPNFPLYIWAGTNDDVIRPVKNVVSLVERYRSFGTKVTYIPWLFGNHISAMLLGQGPARTWIENQFEKAEKVAQFDAILQDENENLPMEPSDTEKFTEGSVPNSQSILSNQGAAQKHSYEL